MEMKRTTIEELLSQVGQIVIDGSMSTALEQMGVKLNHKLWTAIALIQCPEKVKQVHKNYFQAGADCGITCSYQATIPGLMNAGFSQSESEVCFWKPERNGGRKKARPQAGHGLCVWLVLDPMAPIWPMVLNTVAITAYLTRRSGTFIAGGWS